MQKEVTILGKIKVANLCQVFKEPLIWPLISACSSACSCAKVHLPVCVYGALASCLHKLRSEML